jgi:hypothetical protein
MSSEDIKPVIPMPRPVAAALSPQSITGGQSTLYSVTLSAASGTNQTVQLSTDHPEVFANFPSSLTVPAGSLGQCTTLQTNAVAATVFATITALCNGVSMPCTLTVNP